LFQICDDCGKEIFLGDKTYRRTSQYGVEQVICEKCFKKSAGEFYFERHLLARVGCLTPILGIILIIVFLSLKMWIASLVVLVLTILITTISSIVLEKFIHKMHLARGIDTKNIKWCKTCKFFKKSKEWEAHLEFLDKIPSLEKLPCLIPEKTKSFWEEYFKLDHGARTLYPKECVLWERR